MNIKSPLQRRTILEINKLCGIQELTQFATKYKQSINVKDRILINNLIEYYNSLYYDSVNVESDILMFYNTVTKTKDMLIRCIKKRPSKYLHLLLNVISYNIDSMANVKKLA